MQNQTRLEWLLICKSELVVNLAFLIRVPVLVIPPDSLHAGRTSLDMCCGVAHLGLVNFAEGLRVEDSATYYGLPSENHHEQV